MCPEGESIDPIGHEQVGAPGPAIVPVGGKDQSFAIRREHGKGVKGVVESDLFQPCTIRANHEQIEGKSSGMVVGAKENFLAGGVEKWRPIGPAKPGQLPCLASVYSTDEQLHLGGLHQAFREKFPVMRLRFRGLGTARAPDEPFPVG